MWRGPREPDNRRLAPRPRLAYTAGMRPYTAILGLLALAGCGDGFEEEWTRLAGAERRWERADIHSYAFTLHYGCFCPLNGEFAIVVENDVVISAKRIDDSGPLEDTVPAMTVPEMFGRIRTGLESEPEGVTLVFADLGYPELVRFDLEGNAADDEWSFGIDEFTPRDDD